MTVTGLCRGGMFPAADAAGRRAALDDNQRAVDEAAAHRRAVPACWWSAACRKGSRDIVDARACRCATAGHAAAVCAAASVPLAIEPLHPMYAADRACVNTLAQANDLCDELGEGVGVAIDIYHVWWDPDLRAQIARAGTRHLSPITSATGWCRPTTCCSIAA